MRAGETKRAVLAVLALGLSCDGRQSTLAPAGREAHELAGLFWGMTIGSVVIWLLVLALALYASSASPAGDVAKVGTWLIVGGGVVFPVVVLTGLLTYGLGAIPRMLAPAPEGSLQVHVTGHQYWWRVRYQHRDGPVELANEIRLPVDEPAQFILDSPDVIHSFWIPSLAGKMDMIPGRVTRLRMHPTATGVFRGACAEFCGDSHALMAFDVVVMDRPGFDSWLKSEAAPARAPVDPTARRGLEVFLSSGCGACHAIRGTLARGVVGPDLTHLGRRLTIGAATLPEDVPSLVRWIAHTDAVKPGVHMPAFGMLPAEDLEALGTYLHGLE